MIYHKLVRDKIPQIIEEKGGKAEFRTLSQEEYLHYLEAHLRYLLLRRFRRVLRGG